MFTNLNLTDMETFYKLIRRNTAKGLCLKEENFGFEPELNPRLSRISNIRIYEGGISYYERAYEEHKKIVWKAVVRAIYCILKYGLFKGKWIC
tara:strand:- start:1536 stop:1814 length:279 start_codon:yes stop_codon:yes gene_type:complete